MNQSAPLTTVSIRPDVSVLTVLRHLNYKPWYAVAEFVDNSLESFLRHRTEIAMVDGDPVKLRVEISIDAANSGIITIHDNAAGIFANEYERAFRPAVPPPEVDGLSEFGMGMKSAAMWFGRRFTVRSCALGESVERTVVFDIDDIVRNKSDQVPISEISAKSDHHYTEVALSNLRQVPYGKTIGKIKDHLASIYRVFIREGTLEIRFRSTGIDEILKYEEPRILFAPPADGLIRRRGIPSEAVKWCKEIQFELDNGFKVSGFAAIREEGSTTKAGFALFRRNRLIEGSGDESYRPEMIFGASTTAVYQRLFGELQLEGFDVSHTKDGFKWGESEDAMLDSLKEHLNSNPIPLIEQAREAKYKTLQNMNPASNYYDNSIAVISSKCGYCCKRHCL
ncbi:MAG: ATP-binding protein, partial [Nitrososphaerota archaeon]|nr:ATP-binding protein [Nitrososphaerota archaeon]